MPQSGSTLYDATNIAFRFGGEGSNLNCTFPNKGTKTQRTGTETQWTCSITVQSTLSSRQSTRLTCQRALSGCQSTRLTRQSTLSACQRARLTYQSALLNRQSTLSACQSALLTCQSTLSSRQRARLTCQRPRSIHQSTLQHPKAILNKERNSSQDSSNHKIVVVFCVHTGLTQS